MGLVKNKKKASENIKKKICKINGERPCIGFFCKIPLNENENIRVLVTAGRIILKEDLYKLDISINDEQKEIKLDNRIKYTNQKVTLIEIKDSDNISNESFFDIDPEIFKGYTIFLKNELYLYSMDYQHIIYISKGDFSSLSNYDNEFFHTCESEFYSIGGPLINAINDRVIGMDFGTNGRRGGIGVCLKESIEEFKKKVFFQYKNDKDRLTPISINSLDDYKKIYEIKQKILSNKFYTIFSAYSNIDGKLYIVKEYNDDICEKLYDYINEEISTLIKIKNKFITKLKKYYLSKDKSILIFEYFNNILTNNKTKFTLNEIQKFLIQINEALKELKEQNVNDIVLFTENICMNNNNYKLINLFPFYKALKKEQIELDTNSEKYINLNLSDFDQKLLWNLGTLIYEMYFQEFPLEFSEQNIKHSESKDFDILIENLLQINKNKFTWDDYINNNFLVSIPPQKKFMFLYEKNIDELTTGINLEFNQVSEENLVLLSKIELNNLYWLNLSDNKIENLEFFGQGLKNLKILILEFNRKFIYWFKFFRKY